MICAGVKILFVILVVALAAQSISGQGDGPNDVRPADSRDNSGGLLRFLLTPIKATLNQAKRLLGLPTGNVKDFIADGFDEIQMQTFKLFMLAYNKTYDSPAEVRRRMKLFFERRRMIEQSVRDFTEGRMPFIMRENAYTDWDESELKALASASPPRTYQEMTDDEREVIMRNTQDSGELKMQENSQAIGEDQETISLDPASSSSENNPAPAGPSSSNSAGDQPGRAVSQSRLSGYPDMMDYDYDERDIASNDDYMDIDDEEQLYDDEMFDGMELNMTVLAPDRIPASKDWRDSGCVAKPIDQQKCGACYAIATMNTVETMRCINKVSSPILSPQQVVDCSTPRAGYQNHGCDGGWPTRVLKYLQDVRVVTRESCYPFVRRQQTCQMRRVQATEGCTMSASPTGTTLRYRVLDNEQDILYHVARTGPVITVMQALDSFLFYSKGIYDDPKCSRRRDDVDHAIVIVGYGRENGMNYWLIKNSWGTEDWGESGYGKYRRGTRACSIGSFAWVITS